MNKPFKTYSAVFPLILKKEGEITKILLHRRQNTGYMDGKLDVAGSGHVDEGETATAALVRECREELGIEVDFADVAFAHLSHRFAPDRTYYDIYFVVKKYGKTPVIMEREKCLELAWVDISKLPDDVIPCRARVIEEFKGKSFYSEIIE